MNWEAAIARNREALLEIILALMASLGLHKNGMLTTLPFNLYRKALATIRIAETAVRRLIFIAAHDMKLRMAEQEICKINKNGRALISPLEGEMSAKPTERGAPERSSNQYDKLSSRVRIVNYLNTAVAPLCAQSGISPLGVPASGLPLKSGARAGEISAPASEPLFRRYPRRPEDAHHISFPLIEPLKSFTADPRDFACLNHDDKSFSREPTPAFNLGNRLLALHFALTNIDRQARRLLRWEARRDAALKQMRPHRTCPMRPGLPPFYARKPVTEIEKILKECHGLTHYARDNEAFLIRRGVP